MAACAVVHVPLKKIRGSETTSLRSFLNQNDMHWKQKQSIAILLISKSSTEQAPVHTQTTISFDKGGFPWQSLHLTGT